MTKHATFVAHDAVAAQAQQHFSSFLPLATADARDRKKHTAAQKRVPDLVRCFTSAKYRATSLSASKG
jgi:hypothetical protein